MKLYIITCVLLHILICDSRPISSNFKFFNGVLHQNCDETCQLNYLIKYGYIDGTTNLVSDMNLIDGTTNLVSDMNLIDGTTNLVSDMNLIDGTTNLVSDMNLIDGTTNLVSENIIDKNKIIKQGIKNLQKEAGLEETGIMDTVTTTLLQTPRCGVPFDQVRRQKRFTIVRGWNTLKNNNNETTVTWYLDLSNFDQIKGKLSRSIIKKIFATSMAKWSNTSLISLKEVLNENEANITIKFLSNGHGDGYDFDGPGKVLAHAFYPGSARGGDAHFDLDEDWSIWGDEGISLYSVAIHEIGHALGIGHSSVANSVMYAWYRPNHTNLHDDDRLAINSVYGIRPQYKFALLDPKHRIYKSQRTTFSTSPASSTTFPSNIPTFPSTTPTSPSTTFPFPSTTLTSTTFPSTTLTSTTPTSTTSPSTTPTSNIKPTIKNKYKNSKVITTTQKYNLNQLKKISIHNSKVIIYPKHAILSM
jgi:hypothetical protein